MIELTYTAICHDMLILYILKPHLGSYTLVITVSTFPKWYAIGCDLRLKKTTEKTIPKPRPAPESGEKKKDYIHI